MKIDLKKMLTDNKIDSTQLRLAHSWFKNAFLKQAITTADLRSILKEDLNPLEKLGLYLLLDTYNLKFPKDLKPKKKGSKK